MWEELSKYLNKKNVLEIGCGTGQKTVNILKHTNKITAIDISEENIKNAKEKYKNDDIVFLTMDASKLSFENKSFDTIVTTDSFHEIEPQIQDKVLEEMIRCSNTIIFIEPDEISVTNELFKVFDANENHSLRIKTSMSKAFDYMKQNNYKLRISGSYKDITTFTTKERMFDTLLDWWNDIKIPKDDIEKNEMISKIKTILNDFDMLDSMEVFEKINYYVFEKE